MSAHLERGFIDHLDARSVLILVDPAAFIKPAPLFVEASDAP